ncbi:MAG: hypothetical protein JWR84_3562 [Caulobacter sp.]|nr:hypothetical protein [Caulobacter sp.]
MPIIPRYQPRGGPSVGGLNYAGAYSPPDGSDWRLLGQAARAGGAIVDMVQGLHGGEEPTRRGGRPPPTHGTGRERGAHGPSNGKPARSGRSGDAGGPIGKAAAALGAAMAAAGSSLADATALANLGEAGGAPDASWQLIEDAYRPAIDAASRPEERRVLETNRDALQDFWAGQGAQLQAAYAAADHGALADRTLEIGRKAIALAPTYEAVDGLAERQTMFTDSILRRGAGDPAALAMRRLTAARTLRADAELRKAALDPRRYLEVASPGDATDGSSTGLLTAEARALALDAARNAIELDERNRDLKIVADARRGEIDQTWLDQQVAAGALSAGRPAVAQAMKIAGAVGEAARQAQADGALMARVRSGTGPTLDIAAPEHRRALERDFAAFYGQVAPEARGEAIADYVAALGVAPPGALSVLDGLLTSDRPEDMEQAAAAYATLLDIDPELLSGLSPAAVERAEALRQGAVDGPPRQPVEAFDSQSDPEALPLQQAELRQSEDDGVNGGARLIRTSTAGRPPYGKQGRDGVGRPGNPPMDPDDRQTGLSIDERRANRELARFFVDDGLTVDPKTWQVMRGKEVVTRAEAQKFRERRIGVQPQPFGRTTQAERDFQRIHVQRSDPVIDPRRPIPKVFAPRGYTLETGDENLLARIIFAEAGQIPEDYEALAWATLNRIGLDYRATLFDVLVDPGQYDIVKEGGKRTDNELWLRSANPDRDIPPYRKADWERAKLVARGVLSGQVPDPTEGAVLFFSDDDFDGTRGTAPGDFGSADMWGRIKPSPYQSKARGGRKHYFFYGPMDRTRPNRQARPRKEVMEAAWP